MCVRGVDVDVSMCARAGTCVYVYVFYLVWTTKTIKHHEKQVANITPYNPRIIISQSKNNFLVVITSHFNPMTSTFLSK